MTISPTRALCASGLALSLFSLSGCAEPRQAEARPGTSETQTDTPALARRLVRDEGALLLDVRTDSEFEAGHVEGAKLIPHDQVAARVDEISELLGGDRGKPIVLYCRSGNRTKKARTALEQAGFTQVVDLGAMSNWCENC